MAVPRGSLALSRALNTLADLAEIRGDASDAADCRQAAEFIATLNDSAAAALLQRGREDRLQDDTYVPPRAGRRIQELAIDGEEAAIRGARGMLPTLFRALLTLGVVDTNEAALLVRNLGILTLGDLQRGLQTGRILEIFNEDVDARLRQAAPAIAADAAPLPLGRARELAESMTIAVGECAPAVDALVPSGDVRRFESLASDLVLVGRSSDPLTAIEQVCLARGVDEIRHRGSRRVIVSTQGAEVDIHVAATEEYGTVLFSTTGSRAHFQAMRARAGHVTLVPREEDVYTRAGLPYIAPELREDRGEVEAAAAGTLPRLVSVEDIRGDLHMHTMYSDGGDTVDAMVAACCAIGYQYIAITDHSERAAASRTLARRDLARQRDDIHRARDRYPQITILHGVEVDIMPDGSLDFPDRVLESFDIVLASLHESAGHDGKMLTWRCLQAIRHPLVTIVAHPANRLVGRRAGYPLDYDAVFAAAVETGTALEVDGGPSHLDLEGERAREAIAAGATLAIDSDCHRARWLRRQMAMGVGTARRGWVEPRHVLNTRTLDDVRTFIAAKRARR